MTINPEKETMQKQAGFIPFLRQFTMLFLPGCVLLAIVFVTLYVIERHHQTELDKNSELASVARAETAILEYFKPIRSNLLLLANGFELQEFLSGSQAAKGGVAEEYLAMARHEPAFDQVRFLDETGMEIIRVNQNSGSPHVVPDRELQPKGKRYYFAEAYRLSRGEIYISPMDLTIEHNHVDIPYKPILRVGTPVFDAGGNKRGLVLINVLGQELLRRIFWQSQDSPGEIMMLNPDGYWLKGLNPDEELGSMFPDRVDKTFVRAFPEIWSKIAQEDSGQVHSSKGLFTFSRIHPLRNNGVSGARIGNEDYHWIVVSRVSPSVLHARLSGAHRWLALTALAGVVLLAMAAADMTRALLRRKQVENELRESEEKYRLLFELESDAIILIDVETLGIIEANSAALKLYGYSRQEILSLKATDLSAEPEAVLSRISDGVADGKVKERLHRKKDGTVFNVESTANFSAWKSRSALIVAIRDISERKRAGEKLQESELKFRALFESMAEGVALHEVIYDNNGKAVDYRLMDVNPAYEKHTGIGRQQAQWLSANVMYGTVTPPFLTEYEHVARTGRPYAFETFFPPLKKYFSISVVSPKQGQFATVFEDITERKQKAKELQDKNTELTRFIYTVSHDLKSPLVTVKTFLGYLEQDMAADDSDRIEKDIGYMRSAADKMGYLLDELLEMSRIGRVVNAPVRVMFSEVVDEALSAVAGRISERGVKVMVYNDTIPLYGDRPRLVEIWQNLVENAVKYMGEQALPCIEIGVETREGLTVFFVRDNGMGIDLRYKDKIFGLFEKLDPKSEGTGLGLALVKRIIELYRGNIWLESEGLGHGACFQFTLPDAMDKVDDRKDKGEQT